MVNLGKETKPRPCFMYPRFERSFGIKPTSVCEIFDGIVVVQMLKPKTSSTFKDYIHTVFVPYVQGQLLSAQRIDFVWDTYKPDARRQVQERRRVMELVGVLRQQ